MYVSIYYVCLCVLALSNSRLLLWYRSSTIPLRTASGRLDLANHEAFPVRDTLPNISRAIQPAL